MCNLVRSSACSETAQTLKFINVMILTTWGFQRIHSVTPKMALMSDKLMGFHQKFEF